MSKLTSSNAQISFAARSDVGMKRVMNQDAFDVSIANHEDWTEQGHRFVVADGMGAHAAGELASQLAVEEVRKEYNASNLTPREAIVSAFKSANSEIHRRGQADTQLFNMGTTCSSLLILPEGALIGHVGDSRIYRCRNEGIQQLTFDHSLVWEMRAAGQVSDERTASIPRNVITRCLGPHAEVDIDLEGYFSVRKGDTFLLCSDGLTGRISDREIGVIAQHLPPEESVDFLTDLANLRGGSDNITVIVTRVLSRELQADGEVSDSPRPYQVSGTHPAWWLIAGMGLIGCVAGFQFASLPLAATGAIVTLIATCGAAFQWSQQRRDTNSVDYPRAPYATSNTKVDHEFVEGICGTHGAILDALLPSCPELSTIPDQLDRIRQQVSRMESSSPIDCLSLCQQLASIASQLRDKL